MMYRVVHPVLPIGARALARFLLFRTKRGQLVLKHGRMPFKPRVAIKQTIAASRQTMILIVVPIWTATKAICFRGVLWFVSKTSFALRLGGFQSGKIL